MKAGAWGQLAGLQESPWDPRQGARSWAQLEGEPRGVTGLRAGAAGESPELLPHPERGQC